MSSKSISEKRPWTSHSLGVHPKDVKEANEVAKHHGFRHRYNEKGHPECHSNAARRDATKMGISIDYDGGYSDHTG